MTRFNVVFYWTENGREVSQEIPVNAKDVKSLLTYLDSLRGAFGFDHYEARTERGVRVA